MPYSEENKDLKISNVKYLNKDFTNLKSALIEYAKVYFPNSYKDFNETSPGMMLIEMAAYVGDVLSFYIDQQYKEMMLPLAEERRNVINIAKTLGYKVKPTTPAFVELDFTQTVAADTTDINNIKPAYSQAFVVAANQQIKASSDTTIIFETLDSIDFTTSSSYSGDNVEATNIDQNTGLTSEYTITRRVKAISGETKTKTFSIGTPEKFLKLTLPDLNVIEILSVKDANRNNWYEVDYLAQDKIPVSTHYITDPNRSTAYSSLDNQKILSVPVPYTLEYIRTSKRFMVEFDESATSLVFGNGIIRSGQILENDFFESEQVGITLPGSTSTTLKNSLDPLLGDENSTLGETPAHTTLTVTYRVGGGTSANVTAGDLITLGTVTLDTGTNNGTLAVTNEKPAAGGSGTETITEIKERASAFFASQNRCVTRDDYKARVLNMPAKYGNIAKVYVDKVASIEVDGQSMNVDWSNIVDHLTEQIQLGDVNQSGTIDVADVVGLINSIMGNESGNMPGVAPQYILDELKHGIAIHTLSYDNNKNLTLTPPIIHSNLASYLEEFRILTDEVQLHSGKIINFGVLFDVSAARTANKQEVKLLCIQKIIDYFQIDKMQFRQPINTNDLMYELMGVEGVRSVNHVTLTQDFDWSVISGLDNIANQNPAFGPGLWTTVYATDLNAFNNDVDNNGGQEGYGYHYDFSQFYGSNPQLEKGFILPSVEPAIFELKHPRENVKGVVR